MIRLRAARKRGKTDLGWLDSRHTFSFAEYHDPEQMGFRSLRVINEDRVRPGEGFGTHFHRDMEILTYILEGALRHHDSMGNGSTLQPDEIQRMSAGTGVLHSEMNASSEEPVHFYQIWILPDRPGLAPGYEQRAIPREPGRFVRIAGPEGGELAVSIHQDASLHRAILPAGAEAEYVLGPGRHAWVQVARGRATLNGTPLLEGDGAAVSDESKISIRATEAAEILLFDLA